MAQIVGSTLNRRPTRPPSCGGLPTGRSAAVGHPADRWHHAGRLPVVTRGPAPTLVISADLSGAAFARSRSRARAIDRPPNLGVGEAGDDGPAGGRPRAMPLRAAPGESSGLRRVQPEPNATRNRCYRRPLRALRGACQRCKRTAPRRSLAAEGPGNTGRPLRASLSLIPPLLRGHTGGNDGGRG
jgi:hypothetical protein